MGADLKSNSMFDRRSLLIMDDAVVILDHRRHNEDRVRRIPYESLSVVLVYRRIPWLSVVTIILVLAVPGLLIAEHHRSHPNPQEVTLMIAIVLGVLLAIGLSILLFYRKTTILFEGVTGEQKMSVICSRGKIRKLLAKLLPLVEQHQRAVRAAADARVAGLSDDTPLPLSDNND